MCIYFYTLENKKDKHGKPWTRFVTAKCGKCPECRRARAREWQQRLDAELRFSKSEQKPRFITFTFTDEKLAEYNTDGDYEKENLMVKKEVELWRKRLSKAKVKQRHWMITEHGQDKDKSERIHIHGIIWADDWDAIAEKWQAGFADIGEIRPSTIGYLIKYVHKEPEVKKDYQPIVLCTPGIGKCYVNKESQYRHRWRGENTNYQYILENGLKVELCDYYKKKFYTENQLVERRRIIWESKKLWVSGIEYDMNTEKGRREMNEKLTYEQKKHPREFGKVKKNTLLCKWKDNQDTNLT